MPDGLHPVPSNGPQICLKAAGSLCFAPPAAVLMSEFFGDMTSIRFSLCEECLFKLVKTFKIPHEEKNELTFETTIDMAGYLDDRVVLTKDNKILMYGKIKEFY